MSGQNHSIEPRPLFQGRSAHYNAVTQQSPLPHAKSWPYSGHLAQNGYPPVLAPGFGVFAEPFYIPKFYPQNRAFVSRGGGTRTHTVRVLSPVEYVRSRFQLFSNPLIYAQFSSTRLFSVRPCLWWVGVLVGVVAWA